MVPQQSPAPVAPGVVPANAVGVNLPMNRAAGPDPCRDKPLPGPAAPSRAGLVLLLCSEGLGLGKIKPGFINTEGLPPAVEFSLGEGGLCFRGFLIFSNLVPKSWLHGSYVR